MTQWDTQMLRRRVVLIFCAVLLLTGCATTKPEPAASPVADPQAVQNALDQADQALSKGDFSSARKGYRRILALAPETTAAQLGLGEIELAAGDPRQALDYFNSVAATDPSLRPGALQGQGLALIRLGRPEGAMPLLKEAVTLDPGLWRAWNALGSLEDSRRDWAAADEAYQRALALKPDAALVLNNMGVSKMMRGDYLAAEQVFAKVLTADPDMEEAAANLRIAQAWQGRYDDAIQGVNNETLAQRLNDVGYVAMLRGDLAVAETLFLRAISASPTYHKVAYENLQQVGRLKAAGTPATTPAVFE
ncbi:MAG TPA: tetratricopeptide repeat protein [Alphaproteobacteria bacterium]|nr:tetratricopeptide repeat protein [Alphaproteobacteria bacterium]